MPMKNSNDTSYNVEVSSIFPTGYVSNILIGRVLIPSNGYCLYTTDFCFVRQIIISELTPINSLLCYKSYLY
jgi:hypothetical protein